MARILVITNGTAMLRGSIAALRLAGHRVTPRETITTVDAHRASPDLVIVASGDDAVSPLIHALRADATLRRIPVIVAGAADDAGAFLSPLDPVADTVVLPAPLDPAAVFDAAHLFVPAVPRRRLPPTDRVA